MDYAPHILRRLETADPHILLWKSSLEAQQKNRSTIENYLWPALHLFEFCERKGYPTSALDISKVHVTAWLADMNREVTEGTISEYTVKSRFVHARLFFRWLKAEEFVPEEWKDPFAKLSIPKTPEPFKPLVKPDEVERMLQYLEARKRLRDAALIAVLYDTGMRATEAVRLKWSDFQDRAYRRLLLGTETTRRTKARTIRDVWLGNRTASLLLRLHMQQSRQKKLNEWVFPTRNGTPMNRGSAHKLVSTVGRAVGIERTVGLHVFRHTWSCNMLLAGVTPQALKEAGGWTDLTMVEHYTRRVAREVASAQVSQFSPLDRLRG